MGYGGHTYQAQVTMIVELTHGRNGDAVAIPVIQLKTSIIIDRNHPNASYSINIQSIHSETSSKKVITS